MSHDGHRFPAMGADVLVHGATAGELEAIEALFADWDRVFSRFRPDSELNRVNRDPSPVVVLSRPFAFALRAALEAAEATGGLVDPTLGAAVEAAFRPYQQLTEGARGQRGLDELLRGLGDVHSALAMLNDPTRAAEGQAKFRDSLRVGIVADSEVGP